MIHEAPSHRLSPPAGGSVSLVGAGPGDPELLTVRGLRLLRRADVVVHDRLVDPRLLDEAPADAERVYVGKGPGRPSTPQEEINRILVQRALAGRRVVRLKGGDPFVFARGGEEAAACAALGIPVEIVPGITSAVGVPGRCGIPVTHRGVAASFAVLTAHRAADLDDVDWPALARLDTLVILMGVRRLPYVCANLVRAGRAPETPAAIIHRGTWADERHLVATLATLPEKAAQAEIQAPATIVVGPTVGLREAILGRAPLPESVGTARKIAAPTG